MFDELNAITKTFTHDHVNVLRSVSLESVRRKIAVVGSGISGLTCAWILSESHDVTVYESGSYVGGHTNTVDVELPSGPISVDTGFIVCNDRTYPNFLKLMDFLAVKRSPTEMSFSVRDERFGMEYSGTGLGSLFAQRRNLIRPSFLRMVADILRFNHFGSRDAATIARSMTVDEYLTKNWYSEAFRNHYLLPMGASIWSCPVGKFGQFPIRFILEFYSHHGLLSLTNRPQWYVINGGSRQYVRELTRSFSDRIRLNCPVKFIRRQEHGVEVCVEDRIDTFDDVIIACHADTALGLLQEPDTVEQELLAAFPYEPNTAILHTDTSVLPQRRKIWSSWNYRLSGHSERAATLTYNMNILQHLKCPETVCVSMNENADIDESKVLRTFRYSHPVFSVGRHAIQQRHHEVIRRNGVSFCGAYWRNGFHEDGVVSALNVCRAFGATDVLDRSLSAAGRSSETEEAVLL